MEHLKQELEKSGTNVIIPSYVKEIQQWHKQLLASVSGDGGQFEIKLSRFEN